MNIRFIEFDAHYRHRVLFFDVFMVFIWSIYFIFWIDWNIKFKFQVLSNQIKRNSKVLNTGDFLSETKYYKIRQLQKNTSIPKHEQLL